MASSLFNFLRIYKDLAKESFRTTPEDVVDLYMDLRERTGDVPRLHKWFQKSVPSRLEMVLAIDAVAHDIHKHGDSSLQVIYPGARLVAAKSVLDQLSGLETETDIRKSSRGFFTNILMDTKMLFLEKQEEQVGLTTLDEIKDAIKEYKRRFAGGMASPAEILTLSRYDPDNPKYQLAIMEGDLLSKEPMVVGGPASVELVDREGHLITTEALDEAFEKFIANPRYANIMIMHTDVQVATAMPAYITANGRVYRSGVDDSGLWLISELRDDIIIAEKTIEKIESGEIQSYSIAGSATDTEDIWQNGRRVKKVNALELAEVTLCARGVNQGAYFNVLKSLDDKDDVEDAIGNRIKPTNDDEKEFDGNDFIEDELNEDDNFEEIRKRIQKDVDGDGSIFDAYEDVDYRPSEEEGYECHLCKYFSEGFCTYLEYPVKEEYVCDEFYPMPKAELADEWAEVIRMPYEERVQKSALDNYMKWVDRFYS